MPGTQTIPNPTGAFGQSQTGQDNVPSSSLASGFSTLDRINCDNTAIATGTGTLRFVFFTAPFNFASTSVRACTGGTAAAPTPTICRYGLYLVDSAGNMTLVASTTNDTTLFASTTTMYTKAWTTPYTFLVNRRYAVSAFVVSGGATPTLQGRQPGGGFATDFGLAPRLAGSLSGQSDLPASTTIGSLTDIGAYAYYAFS